jgi:ABC-type dipeptide/oligopeptide/nickel transport system permease component
MIQFLLRRLALLPFVLLAAHFVGYMYAVLGRRFQIGNNPFFAQDPAAMPSVWAEYAAYAATVAQSGLGKMAGGSTESLTAALARTGLNSLGLLLIAFGLSVLFGLVIGLYAVRTQPVGAAPWLAPLASVSLSMPSFYIGAVLVTASIFYLLNAGKGATLPLPLRGYGWDEHLVLPVLVLMVRPAMQIAQVAATTLSGELGKVYVIASRSFGYTWRAIRWSAALKNALAPIVLAIGSAFRLMAVELILVEWLFGWPGLGRLFAEALFRPRIASVASATAGIPPGFLYPPLVAAMLAIFAVVFVLADTLAAAAARGVDPRYRAHEDGKAG